MVTKPIKSSKNKKKLNNCAADVMEDNISYLKMAKKDQRDISYLSLDIQACSLVWT
jgi:hypothetical protein